MSDGFTRWLHQNGYQLADNAYDKRGRGKFEVHAKCYSVICGRYGVVKQVSKDTIDCPDCDHALVWSKIGRVKHAPRNNW